MFNFLALLDIRVFGRLYLWLLIGLTLFLQPGCFCLALKFISCFSWTVTPAYEMYEQFIFLLFA